TLFRSPWLRQGRDPQVRDAEAGQSRLGAAAAPGRALVADLAARARAGTGERRDRGRVVVGLDLDAERAFGHRLAAVLAAVRIRPEAPGRIALDHRGVVAVGRERVLRRARVGVADHPEQRQRLFLAVHGPG